MVDFDGVVAHFERTLSEYGPTPRGVDWQYEPNAVDRFLRLDQLTLEPGVESVSELGCGYGGYLEHLREVGYTGSYVGVDIAPAMIDAARARFPSDRFEVGSTAVEADVVVASGIFNVRGGNDELAWAAHIEETVTAMWAVARRGLVFDVLMMERDPITFAPDFHYVDVEPFLADLGRLGPATIEARRDYSNRELTVFVRAS